MTAKLDYQWHLRELMAVRGMFSTTDLRPLLAERDINLSASQVFRLVTEKPERLSMKTLMALLDILGCRMEELIEPVRVTGRRRRDPGPRSRYVPPQASPHPHRHPVGHPSAPLAS